MWYTNRIHCIFFNEKEYHRSALANKEDVVHSDFVNRYYVGTYPELHIIWVLIYDDNLFSKYNP